jgi:hypothetical protein
LTKISIHDLAWMSASCSPTSPEKCLSSNLHTLDIGSCLSTSDIFNWMLAQKPVPIIHHIHLNRVDQEGTFAIGKCLASLGSALHTLSVQFSGLDAGGDACMFYCNLCHACY